MLGKKTIYDLTDYRFILICNNNLFIIKISNTFIIIICLIIEKEKHSFIKQEE